jgi:hypothetical protein
MAEASKAPPLLSTLYPLDADGFPSSPALPFLQKPGVASDSLPYRGSELLQEASCTAEWRPFKTLDYATAVWSANSEEYNRYAGVDMEPDHPPWPVDDVRRVISTVNGELVGGDWAKAVEDGLLVNGTTGQLQVGECKAPRDDEQVGGGIWQTQRVGPFESTGGFDWHSISWRDPAFASRGPTAHLGAFGVLAHFTGPVDATGSTAIGYPPIHQHHTHIVPEYGDTALTDCTLARSVSVPPHQFMTARVGAHADHYWSNHRLMVIHGDWVFPGVPDVVAMGQDYQGFVKLGSSGVRASPSLCHARTRASNTLAHFHSRTGCSTQRLGLSTLHWRHGDVPPPAVLAVF